MCVCVCVCIWFSTFQSPIAHKRLEISIWNLVHQWSSNNPFIVIIFMTIDARFFILWDFEIYWKMGVVLSKLESAKNSLFQSVNEVRAVKSAKETMRLRSHSENFGTVAPSCLRWTSLAHSHKHTYMYTDMQLFFVNQFTKNNWMLTNVP